MRRSVLRSYAQLALQGLSRCASSSSAAAQQLLAIPAEVAQLVSVRGGMAALPADVEAAVAVAAADANRKAVKKRGQELAYRLRHMSRSKHRGGVHPNLSEQHAAEEAEAGGAATAARRQRRGKRRQSRAAALELLTRSAALPVETSSRLPNLDEYMGSLAEVVGAEEAAQAAANRGAVAARSSIADGGSLYDVPAALAYAAARLPACYAALSRALGEVAGRRPGWRPANQLDFGAGPGTAVWAAQQVWREAPLDALAVEPANAMAWLGHEIQQRQREVYDAAVAAQAAAASSGSGGGDSAAASAVDPRAAPTAAAAEEAAASDSEEEGDERGLPVPPPRLRWMYKLPPQYRAAQGRRYNLVTAGYVLGELKGDTERRRMVQQLWDRTADGGVLVLVEPGTPAGAAAIQRARTQLLEAAAAEVAAGRGDSSAAHVVAPCPHDGACPMEGRPSWCHFVQRFQRTQLQRAAKASAGIQPRTYQDERFSYIAIARGPRPAAHAPAQQPLVAGSLMPSLEDPQDMLTMPANLKARKVPADARPLVMYADSEGEEEEGGSDLEDWWGEEGDEAERESGYAQDSSSLNDEVGPGSGGSDAGSGSGSSSSSEEEEEEEGHSSSSSSSGSSSSESESEAGSDTEGPAALQAVGASSAAGQLAGLDEATRRLLLESIADEDDEDGSGGAALAGRLHLELLAAAEEQRHAAAAAAAAAGEGGLERPVVVLAPVSEATADKLYDGERVDWAAAEPAAMVAAQLASGSWSRVIRTPRKRSGHVVVDLCSAADASGSGQEGMLLRQVVSKAAAKRDVGGTAAYRLARRLRWGDLWPHHYQQSFRAEEAPMGGGLGD